MATVEPEEASGTDADNNTTEAGIEELDEATKAKKLEELSDLEKTLDGDTPIESIPEILHGCPLNEISQSTTELLCQHLDHHQDILSESKKMKNYIGLSEWAGLEHRFTKHIASMHDTWKTKEVITRWTYFASQNQLERKATLGNLALCLDGEGGIDRPDVLTDTAPYLVKDACKWLRGALSGISLTPTEEDTSWQLTIHDAVSGVRTQYTSCLVYADEDHGMAEVITKVFTNVLPNVKFFRPQFHLKLGLYECETTAAVIEERCKGRVIFIISDYFFAAPELCRFALNFSRTLDIVMFGKKTDYLACLAYADADIRMADMVTDLYKSVCTNALFFKPQFDLLAGKYEYDTTARVIEERCGGKVVCLVSQYFMASEMCQFAAQFAMALKDGKQGQQLPVFLDKITRPRFLIGRVGINWYSAPTRKHHISNLTCQLMAGTMPSSQMEKLLASIEKLIESGFLSDSSSSSTSSISQSGIGSTNVPNSVTTPSASDTHRRSDVSSSSLSSSSNSSSSRPGSEVPKSIPQCTRASVDIENKSVESDSHCVSLKTSLDSFLSTHASTDSKPNHKHVQKSSSWPKIKKAFNNLFSRKKNRTTSSKEGDACLRHLDGSTIEMANEETGTSNASISKVLFDSRDFVAPAVNHVEWDNDTEQKHEGSIAPLESTERNALNELVLHQLDGPSSNLVKSESGNSVSCDVTPKLSGDEESVANIIDTNKVTSANVMSVNRIAVNSPETAETKETVVSEELPECANNAFLKDKSNSNGAVDSKPVSESEITRGVESVPSVADSTNETRDVHMSVSDQSTIAVELSYGINIEIMKCGTANNETSCSKADHTEGAGNVIDSNSETDGNRTCATTLLKSVDKTSTAELGASEQCLCDKDNWGTGVLSISQDKSTDSYFENVTHSNTRDLSGKLNTSSLNPRFIRQPSEHED